jgi:hypothetical protein
MTGQLWSVIYINQALKKPTFDGFKTIAGTPNFPSYTSGHSVFSAAGSEFLA